MPSEVVVVIIILLSPPAQNCKIFCKSGPLIVGGRSFHAAVATATGKAWSRSVMRRVDGTTSDTGTPNYIALSVRPSVSLLHAVVLSWLLTGGPEAW